MEMIQVFFSKVLNWLQPRLWHGCHCLAWHASLSLSRHRLVKVESKTESIPGITRPVGRTSQEKLGFPADATWNWDSLSQEVSIPKPSFAGSFEQSIYCRHCYVEESTPESLQLTQKDDPWTGSKSQYVYSTRGYWKGLEGWSCELTAHSTNPVEPCSTNAPTVAYSYSLLAHFMFF